MIVAESLFVSGTGARRTFPAFQHSEPMTPRRAQVVGPPLAQQQFLTGIHAVANLLAPTLGPLGGRVAGSANNNSKIEQWDDAATTVRRLISLGTPQADIGAMLMRNMIWRLQQRVGDGGATAAVLARTLAAGGIRLLAAGVNAMELARGLQEATRAAVDALRAQARPVHDEDTLARIALTVTGEADLSALLGEMRFLLGAEGQIQIEKFVAPYLERRYISGAHWGAQISSMYFYTNVAQRSAVIAQSAVALLDEPLTDAEGALALLETALARKAESLLIIAPDVSGAALGLLVANQQAPAERRRLALLAVKLMALTEERSTQLADIGVLTGARLLGRQQGRSARGALPADLGSADRVEFGPEGITISAADRFRPEIRREAAALQARLDTLPHDDGDRPALLRRLSTFTGGIGLLKIGAHSQLERDVLHETAGRALKVLGAALRGGVVAGGGATFAHAAAAVRALPLSGDALFGARLLADTLSAPLEQIARNAGADAPTAVALRVAEAGAPTTYDATTGRMVDAFAAGILDAASVAEAVLRNATSCALMALTTGTIVYHAKPEQSFEP